MRSEVTVDFNSFIGQFLQQGSMPSFGEKKSVTLLDYMTIYLTLYIKVIHWTSKSDILNKQTKTSVKSQKIIIHTLDQGIVPKTMHHFTIVLWKVQTTTSSFPIQ